MISRNDDVEIFCTLVHETDRAVLVNDGTREVWLAKSTITNPEEFPDPGESFELTIPEWLAGEKGLI